MLYPKIRVINQIISFENPTNRLDKLNIINWQSRNKDDSNRYENEIISMRNNDNLNYEYLNRNLNKGLMNRTKKWLFGK